MTQPPPGIGTVDALGCKARHETRAFSGAWPLGGHATDAMLTVGLARLVLNWISIQDSYVSPALRLP